MKKLKNKIVAITISMLFILSMTASLMLIPSALAQLLHHQPSQHGRTSMLDLTPQESDNRSPLAFGFLCHHQMRVAHGDRWMDMTVTVTSPDGTNKTLGTI